MNFLMRIPKLIFNLFIICPVLFFSGCQSETYDMADFKKIKKIDVHVHVNSENPAFLEIAAENNFKLMSINVDYPDFPSVESQQKVAEGYLRKYPDLFAFASTFYMNGWDNSEWVSKTIKHMDSTFLSGAVGVKFWKNIGMVSRDAQGELIMINNSKFDPVITNLTKRNIPAIFHCGEPRDCWLAVDSMMSNDMKVYFSNHPVYHMYLHPEMPSYQDQITARNAMLDKNPQLTFIGAHIGSLEWSIDEVAKFLDKYPNAYVDLAARMDYIQLQSKKNRDKVRKFFTDYSKRILYGSDLIINPVDDAKVFKKVANEKWLSDWKYLATDLEMSVPIINGSFEGLALPKDVLDNIYYKNAANIFNTAWSK